MTEKIDNVEPLSHWTFDGDVTDVFDDMLQRSIPQYDVMRKTATDIGASFVTPDSYIVDLGCSRGEALARFVEMFKERNSYMGLEISEPMIQVASQRFKDSPYNIAIESYDLRNGVTLPDHMTPSLTYIDCFHRVARLF
jgi:tRNA (cmo5U34)-methyltransferase